MAFLPVGRRPDSAGPSAVLRRSGSEPDRSGAQRREGDPQLLDRPEHAVLGRARADTEQLRDLLNRTPFVVAERERCALERAQVSECLGHLRGDFRALREPLGTVTFGRRERHDDFETVSPRLIVARLPSPHHVYRAVGDDPVEPGAEIGPRFESPQLPIGAEKALLDHVFCVLLVAGHAERQPEDGPAMAFDQYTERVAIALAGAGQDGRSLSRVHLGS